MLYSVEERHSKSIQVEKQMLGFRHKEVQSNHKNKTKTFSITTAKALILLNSEYIHVLLVVIKCQSLFVHIRVLKV